VRTVVGPTGRVVVVGAGLGGLSAALRLLGAGREVTILERGEAPGGRAGRLEIDGYRFDTGPTVLTMPGLVADALGCVGERLDDWLELRRLDPAYRAHYPDGSTLDVRASVEETAAEIAQLCGPSEADGFRRFVAFTRRLYDVEMRTFIDRNLDSPLSLLVPDLARLVALGGFRRLAPKVASYLHDPRTRRLFSFQALYAGVSPFEALALYAVISYMDTVEGVWFPAGGIHAVPEALAGAAAKHGADLHFGCAVPQVEVRGGRAVAVHTTDGRRFPADVVVLAGDRPAAVRDLLPAAAERPRRLRHSPSCFLLHVGSSAAYSRIAHHNVHFGRAWRSTFDELIGRRRLPTDPSLLVTNPTRSDPSLAPAGRQAYYVLVPVPHLDGQVDWDVIGPRFREEVVGRLGALGYVGFSDAVEVSRAVTPADWQRQGLAAGSPFGAAHTFRQTGPFRPGNLLLDNVVLAGSGTQPGIGVPMVLVSGRLAAERIVGG
jgi:phytoene desaturase